MFFLPSTASHREKILLGLTGHPTRHAEIIPQDWMKVTNSDSKHLLLKIFSWGNKAVLTTKLSMTCPHYQRS